MASTDDRVLVIDDDPDIRETLSVVLETYGYTVTSKADGADALAWLRSEPKLPRLILLDLMMPNMNGIEFRAAQLADPALASIPVVVMTGAPSVSRDPALAGLDVLVKPIALKTLLAQVVRYCDDAPAPVSSARSAPPEA
jgi:CheY-like chemotaxis protein